LAGELGLADRIDFTGFIPHHRVAGAIADSAAAVIPLPDNPMARYFTSPLKLYEYMAAGLPIVATDLPAIREVLRHDQNALLVPPGDAPAMAAALDRLLSEPELAERLRSRAFEDVKDRTWASRAAIIAERLDV
jgi:glycosyltransferase involved in cell wall biosynthesis